MIHSKMQVHAAGYSRRKLWAYPDTRYLPHVVVAPDRKGLVEDDIEIMLLVVDSDAWVPEIQVWSSQKS